MAPHPLISSYSESPPSDAQPSILNISNVQKRILSEYVQSAVGVGVDFSVVVAVVSVVVVSVVVLRPQWELARDMT